MLDVFILEEERGEGYSKVMMNAIINHPKLVNITSWKLMTADAHRFYVKSGFHTIKNPTHLMERFFKNEKEAFQFKIKVGVQVQKHGLM